MKKLAVKVIKWFFFFVLAISIIAVTVFVIYLETSIDRVLSKERQKYLYQEIKNSPALPNSYYSTIEKYYSNYFQQNTWGSLLEQLITSRRGDNCQCQKIYVVPNPRGVGGQFIIALDIEEHFSQKQCYNYIMHNDEFGSSIEGIREAAEKFYQKDLHELNEREILELNFIWHAPTYYNPIRNRANLDSAINTLMQN